MAKSKSKPAKTFPRPVQSPSPWRVPYDVADPARLAYSLVEWSRLLGQSRTSTWRQIRLGQLRTVRIGGRTKIPATERVRLGLVEAE